METRSCCSHPSKPQKQHSLRNPIVEQVITETLRVVKDIWNTYGNGAENFLEMKYTLNFNLSVPAPRTH